MSSRFTTAQRDSRSTLFAAYPTSTTSKRASSASPAPSTFTRANGGPRPNSSLAFPGPQQPSPYDSGPYSAEPGGAGTFGAYPGRSGGYAVGGGYASNSVIGSGEGRSSDGDGFGVTGGGGGGGFRSATPNGRGQYSDAVLNELESQNEEQLEGMSKRVRMLKDITISIGDEIRSSTALAEKMNDSFDNTRVRLRGTMNRMLVMAKKTGVGWKAWLAFIGAVVFLFWYVWLF